jgi:predicted GNAT superfamily acetyltransferase
MMLHTCSEVISFARQLENESASFYENLSQKYAKDEDVFLSFAKENKKNIVQIERSYYGVISDAIEGCFAFDTNPVEYTFETELVENAGYSDALNRAVEIEEKIIKFYSDAAEQSKSLMADVPRSFILVAKKRSNRISKLRSLIGE